MVRKKKKEKRIRQKKKEFKFPNVLGVVPAKQVKLFYSLFHKRILKFFQGKPHWGDGKGGARKKTAIPLSFIKKEALGANFLGLTIKKKWLTD